MKHAILGAGGVGGFIGACLARIGDEVTLIVRPETLAQHPKILQVESPFGDFAVGVVVAVEIPPVDVLWVTVKATQLEAALSAVKNLRVAQVILPLLNGVDHVAVLRAKFGVKGVIPAAIAGEMERVTPGHIVHRTPFARLNVGSAGRPALGSTMDQLQSLGFECRFLDDESTLLWGKLVFLAPFALTTTAADKPVGEILSDPHWRSLAEACIEEACAVATAEGARVNPAKVLPGVAAMPPGMRSSMQKDVEQHKEPELDAIAGPILRGGERQGIAVPATRELADAVGRKARLEKTFPID